MDIGVGGGYGYQIGYSESEGERGRTHIASNAAPVPCGPLQAHLGEGSCIVLSGPLNRNRCFSLTKGAQRFSVDRAEILCACFSMC